jgi:hypothetical protein
MNSKTGDKPPYRTNSGGIAAVSAATYRNPKIPKKISNYI